METVHVSAAAVINSKGQVLIAKRNFESHQGGKWEFPGGKVEKGELPAIALCRELHEEINITPLSYRPLIKIHHTYPDKQVLLEVWLVDKFSGVPLGNEGQPIAWQYPEQLSYINFPSANAAIIRALNLPDHYFISPHVEGDQEQYLYLLKKVLKRGVKLLQLRDHNISGSDYLTIARKVQSLCKQYGVKLILNSVPKLLDSIDADGVHLTAKRLFDYDLRPVGDDKFLSASCHNKDEITQASKLNVDFIVISPVKETASHQNSSVLGWQRFQQLCDYSAVPVYALGGMKWDDLNEAYQRGAQGIAGISMFL